MELKLKLFLTNWINILGIFIAVYLACIVSELVKITSVSDIPGSLTTGFLGGLFGVVLYGAIFWIGFILTMFLLDFILMNKAIKFLKLKLLFEWVIVSSPFVYWCVEYTEWIFLVAVVAFAITQLFRANKVIAIIQRSK
jgi:hypothetical protein